MSLTHLYKRAYEGWNYRLRHIAGGRWAAHCRPVSIVLLLTERCNAKCLHCDIWKNTGKEESPTGEQWKKVLSDLRKWLGPVQVVFSGGEALMKPFTVDLAAHATSLGLFLEVLTHGYWEDQGKIERLAATDPWKVTISLDGIGETHTRVRGRPKFWERTSRTLETLDRVRKERKLGTIIRLKNVIMSHNLDDTIEVARFADRDGMEVFYQPIEQNYNTPEDPAWRLQSDNWPKDTLKAIARVRQLIEMKRKGCRIANSFAQLEAMIPYFEDPDAHRVAVMSHDAHEATRSCTALVNVQFQANGDVTVCTGVPPVGNIKQTPIRAIWENRPRFWETGCCLERRCTPSELKTIVPAESLSAASSWKQ
ncbi:MAG: radical SAM protein [Acidobacteria bacterium]|nr:radical SAM protein [Acidobacteriota bacterium]